MQFTKQLFLNSYNNLTNPMLKVQANTYTIKLAESDQAWIISRELLADNNNQYQILGAQMLHRKTQDCYFQLSPENQKELSTYVFSLLFRISQSASRSTISKIAAICAIVIAYGSKNPIIFGGYLSELTSAMQSSISNLRAGLNVIQQIPSQCNELRYSNQKQRKVVQKTILQKSSDLVSIFISVFATKDEQAITRNLQSLVEWASFGLPIMSYPQIVSEILLYSIKSCQNFDLSTEILAHTFKHHVLSTASSLDVDTFAKQQLDSNYLSSIIIIVRFILQSKSYLVQQMNHEYIYMYGFLIKELLLYHPWIIIQDLASVGTPLLQIMLLVLDQKSFKISSVSVDFWKDIHKKIPQKQKIEQFLTSMYMNVYQKLIKKTLRKDLPAFLIRDSDQQERFEDETDDDADNTQKVTFQQYRTNSGFLYETILVAFKRIPSGVDLFFKTVSHLLQTNDQCQIQLGLFIAHSVLDVIKDQNYDVVPSLIDYSCNFVNTNPNIKKNVIKLINLLVDQIRQYDKFQKVLSIILSYLIDSQVSELASRTFDTLMNKMPKHTNVSLVEKMIQNCKHHLRTINNNIIFTKILSGVLILVQKLQDCSLSTQYLQTLMQNSIDFLVSILQNNHISQLELSLIEIQLYLKHFQTLIKQKHSSGSLALSYYTTIFNLLSKVLQLCKAANLMYTSVNSLGITTSIYCQIIKMIGITEIQSLEVVSIAASLSCIHPTQNCELLKILISTIEHASQVGCSFDLLNKWISEHFVNFVSTYLGLIGTTKDPDVIRNFYNVLQKTIKYNPFIFSNLTNSKELIQLSISVLVNIVQTKMLKVVLQFINAVLNISGINMQLFSNSILVGIFVSLQNFGSNNYLIGSQIIIKILKGETQENLNVLFYKILQQTKIKQMQKFALIVKILSFFVFTSDEHNLRCCLIQLGMMVKKMGQDEIVGLEIKYQAAKRALKYKS